MIRQKLAYFVQYLSASRPLLTAYSFWDTITSTSGTYCLGAVASRTFFGDWKYANTPTALFWQSRVALYKHWESEKWC